MKLPIGMPGGWWGSQHPHCCGRCSKEKVRCFVHWVQSTKVRYPQSEPTTKRFDPSFSIHVIFWMFSNLHRNEYDWRETAQQSAISLTEFVTKSSSRNDIASADPAWRGYEREQYVDLGGVWFLLRGRLFANDSDTLSTWYRWTMPDDLYRNKIRKISVSSAKSSDSYGESFQCWVFLTHRKPTASWSKLYGFQTKLATK